MTEQKTLAKPMAEEHIIARIFDTPLKRNLLPKLLLVLPFLAAPFLYFLGRTYQQEFLAELGIPFAVDASDFSAYLVLGFFHGVFLSLAKLVIYLTQFVHVLALLMMTIMVLFYLPKVMPWVKQRCINLTKAIVLKIGKERVFKYFDDFEDNYRNTEILPKLWQIIEPFSLLAVTLWIVLACAKVSIDSAKETAHTIIANANQADCEKAPQINCGNYLEITLKTKDKPKLLKGFNLLSGPKEWAIYQPPSLSGKPTGVLHIIKRDDIQSATHPVSFQDPGKVAEKAD